MPIIALGGANNPNVEARSWLNSIASMGTAGEHFSKSMAAGAATRAANQQTQALAERQSWERGDRAKQEAFDADRAASMGFLLGYDDPNAQNFVMNEVALSQQGPPEAPTVGGEARASTSPEDDIEVQSARRMVTEVLKTDAGRAEFLKDFARSRKERVVRSEAKQVTARFQDLVRGLSTSGVGEMYKPQLDGLSAAIDQLDDVGLEPEDRSRISAFVVEGISKIEGAWREDTERIASGEALSATIAAQASGFGPTHPLYAKMMAGAQFLKSGKWDVQTQQKFFQELSLEALGIVKNPDDPNGNTWVDRSLAVEGMRQKGMNQRNYQNLAARKSAAGKGRSGADSSLKVSPRDVGDSYSEAVEVYKTQFDESGMPRDPNAPIRSVDDIAQGIIRNKMAVGIDLDTIAARVAKRKGKGAVGSGEIQNTTNVPGQILAVKAPVAQAAEAPASAKPDAPEASSEPTDPRVSAALGRIEAVGASKLAKVMQKAGAIGISVSVANRLDELHKESKKKAVIDALKNAPAELLERLAAYAESLR